MIIHLESGACHSEIDIFDLNESAAMCFQWKGYIDEEYREELLGRGDLKAEYNETVFPSSVLDVMRASPSSQASFNTCTAKRAVRT
jgi:hypothetical protein